MVEPFLGKWAMKSTENFEEYMQALGVNFSMRKMGIMLKPNTIISLDGDMVKLRTESTFKNTEITFKLGEEFDEKTADNRNVKSTVTMDDDGTLVHVQKWDGKETSLIRKVDGNKLTLTLKFGDIICIRQYEKSE